MAFERARWRFQWFGLHARKSLPRGPRWFRSRGPNYIYFSLGGVCSVTVPWFWHRAAIESHAFSRGWNAGYQAGCSATKRGA